MLIRKFLCGLSLASLALSGVLCAPQAVSQEESPIFAVDPNDSISNDADVESASTVDLSSGQDGFASPNVQKSSSKWDFNFDEVAFRSGPLSQINQGVIKAHPFPPVMQSLKFYAQFCTRAFFDVVRCDDDLARGLADLKMHSRGISQEDRDLFLMRELASLAQSEIFYVLADVRDKDHENLMDVCAAWRMFLLIEDGKGTRLTPDKIQEVEFDAETRMLFGPNWRDVTAQKVPYRVTFNRGNIQASKCSLIFSSPEAEDRMTWNI